MIELHLKGYDNFAIAKSLNKTHLSIGDRLRARGYQLMLRPLDIKVSLEDEIEKCIEEDSEFIAGVLKEDRENIIEEFWDSVQAKINVMDMMGIPIKEINEGLHKHLDKMKSRGYKFKT